MTTRSILLFLCLMTFVSACAPEINQSSLNAFQKNLQNLCGKTFEGVVISTDPQDEAWRQEILTLGPVSCPDDKTTRLPLAVGSDESRIWTLSLQDSGQHLDFRHTHFLKDGSLDPVTGYGGIATVDISTSTRAIFPVDEISKAIFSENGLDASMTNTWSIEIYPNQKMIYKLTREGRNFVAEFDLENSK